MGDKKVDLLISEGNKDLFAHLANENFDNLILPYDEKKGDEEICEDFLKLKCKLGKECPKKHTF